MDSRGCRDVFRFTRSKVVMEVPETGFLEKTEGQDGQKGHGIG